MALLRLKRIFLKDHTRPRNQLSNCEYDYCNHRLDKREMDYYCISGLRCNRCFLQHGYRNHQPSMYLYPKKFRVLKLHRLDMTSPIQMSRLMVHQGHYGDFCHLRTNKTSVIILITRLNDHSLHSGFLY